MTRIYFVFLIVLVCYVYRGKGRGKKKRGNDLKEILSNCCFTLCAWKGRVYKKKRKKKKRLSTFRTFISKSNFFQSSILLPCHRLNEAKRYRCHTFSKIYHHLQLVSLFFFFPSPLRLHNIYAFNNKDKKKKKSTGGKKEEKKSILKILSFVNLNSGARICLTFSSSLLSSCWNVSIRIQQSFLQLPRAA